MFPATLTVTVHNPSQMAAFVVAMGVSADEKNAVLGGTLVTPTADLQAVVNKAEAKVKPDPKPADKAADKPAAQTAHTEPTASAGEGAAQEQTTYDYDTQVKPRVLALIRGGKRTNVADLFKKYGDVKVASDIAADRMGDFMADIAKLEA